MRCYNGCPDAELQAIIDDVDEAHKELAAAGARATYFPMEGKWRVFVGLKINGEFQPTVRAAAEAFKRGRK